MRSVWFHRSGVFAAIAAIIVTVGLSDASASRVVLEIRAGNPIEKPQKVQIKTSLPQRITTNDIISLAGLDLGYDMKKDVYFVHKDLELGPKQVVVYEVELKDIWVTDPAKLALLRQQAATLCAKLKGEAVQAIAESLRDEVDRDITRIEALQDQNSIAAGTSPLQHIRAYEQNEEALARTRKLVGRIENLALAAGIDPGSLVGAAQSSAPISEPGLASNAYKTLVYKITVRNTSPDMEREIPIHSDLPDEIKVEDIVDAGGMSVGKDAKTGRTSVYLDKVKIPAGETVTFDVKIRDKWNINAERIDGLRTNALDLLEKIKAQKNFASLEEDVQDLVTRADAIAAEKGPPELSAAYVAFYRDQSSRLRDLEEKLYRIESALRPVVARNRWGFNPKPPSPKTTWMIIYTIIAFLGLLSLIFMLRWLGRSKSEQMDSGASPNPPQGE